MTPMLEVRDLQKYFPTPRGLLHAVDRVNFTIERGKVLGVVGESGCGKSTLGRTVIHLLEPTGGQIFFDGRDITSPDARQLRALRERMQIIFQDPYSSLDPKLPIEEAIAEPLITSRRFSRAQRRDMVTEMMELVGIDERLRRAYPHELDGGRRQRVVIGRALIMQPEFVVCDEPVSALDVSIQAQVLNLLQDLREKRNLTYIFVTHDMSVVRHISDDICVMYLGQIVEKSPSKELFSHSLHPYTQALISAIPSVDIHHRTKRVPIKGELTSPVNPKPGCRFMARCPFATEQCAKEQPLTEITPGHFVACNRVVNKEI